MLRRSRCPGVGDCRPEKAVRRGGSPGGSGALPDHDASLGRWNDGLLPSGEAKMRIFIAAVYPKVVRALELARDQVRRLELCPPHPGACRNIILRMIEDRNPIEFLREPVALFQSVRETLSEVDLLDTEKAVSSYLERAQKAVDGAVTSAMRTRESREAEVVGPVEREPRVRRPGLPFEEEP